MLTSKAATSGFAAVMVVLALPAAARADSAVSGSFRFADHKTQIAHACTYLVPDDAKPGSHFTQLFMTATPMDCGPVVKGFDPYNTLRDAALAVRMSYVVLNIGASDSPDGEYSTPEVSGGYPYSFGSPDTKPAITLHTPSRVEGRWRNATPQDFMGKSYDFDIRFAVDIVDPDIGARRLQVGGEAPGKALQDFIAAVARKDTAEIRKNVVAETADELLQTLEFTRGLLPANATVSGGLEKSDLAALDIEGVSHDGSPLRGRILMRRVGDEWRYLASRLRVVY